MFLDSLLIEAFELEASYIVHAGKEAFVSERLLGTASEYCDAIVNYSRVYFDTSSFELAQGRDVIALVQRPSGCLAIVWKSAAQVENTSTFRKTERIIEVQSQGKVEEVLNKLASCLALRGPLRPVLHMDVTRYYRVFRRSEPSVHLSLDVIQAGLYPHRHPLTRTFFEVECSGSISTDLYITTLHEFSGDIVAAAKPIESKYKFFANYLAQSI